MVVLRKCEPKLSYVLAESFNMSLKESCFPDHWKVLSLVPLFKNVAWQAPRSDKGVPGNLQRKNAKRWGRIFKHNKGRTEGCFHVQVNGGHAM